MQDGQSIYFLCPDNPRPSGGVGKIYEFAAALRREQMAAFVVHQSRGFRQEWSDPDARVINRSSVTLRTGDVVVVPELWGHYVPRIPGVPKVILNQGHFIARDQHFLNDDVIAIVTVSKHGFEHSSRAYPGKRIEHLRLGLDHTLFRPGDKKLQLAYMARRRKDDAEWLIETLRRNGSLRRWKVVGIEGMTPRQVAAVLAETSVFLSFSHREGFGLPPLEAMASGCLVIGYHGCGGSEYFDRRYCYPISEDDRSQFLATATEVLGDFHVDHPGYAEMAARASGMVTTSYTMERQHESVCRVFREILLDARTWEAPPRTGLPRIRPHVGRLRQSATHLRRAVGVLVHPAWDT